MKKESRLDRANREQREIKQAEIDNYLKVILHGGNADQRKWAAEGLSKILSAYKMSSILHDSYHRESENEIKSLKQLIRVIHKMSEWRKDRDIICYQFEEIHKITAP